jgi:hypothetical protein
MFYNYPERLKELRSNLEQGKRGIYNPLLERIYNDARDHLLVKIEKGEKI